MRYSQWNLLEDELNGESSQKLLGKIWHKAKQSSSYWIDIYVPVPLFVRGKAFCKDIEELSGMKFTQESLLNLLYHNDWLMSAKRANNLMALYHLLTSLEPNKKAQDDAIYSVEGGTPRKRLHVELRRRHLLRGEMLLADLEGAVPKHGYTVEKVYELLYIDFMSKHKSGRGVVERVLKLLED